VGVIVPRGRAFASVSGAARLAGIAQPSRVRRSARAADGV